MSKEKYSIDELYVDLSSIYSDYERGKINKELVTETASNICQAFIIGKKFSDAELDIIEGDLSFRFLFVTASMGSRSGTRRPERVFGTVCGGGDAVTPVREGFE